ncbi:MAG: hypothetical protein Q9218_001576 [Villophora microphyllina]
MAAEYRLERARRGGLSTAHIIWPEEEDGKVSGWAGCIGWLLQWKTISTTSISLICFTMFEATHNSILQMADKYTGIAERNSYSLGVAEGLLLGSEEQNRMTEEAARANEAHDLVARIKKEESEDLNRLDRLRLPLSTLDSAIKIEDDDQDNQPTTAGRLSAIVNEAMAPGDDAFESSSSSEPEPEKTKDFVLIVPPADFDLDSTQQTYQTPLTIQRDLASWKSLAQTSKPTHEATTEQRHSASQSEIPKKI